MDSPQTLHDFVLNLLSNPDAQMAFRVDPEGALHDAGLSDVNAQDVQEAIPLVVDYAPAQAVAGLEGSLTNLADDALRADMSGAIQQIQLIAQQFPVGQAANEFSLAASGSLVGGDGLASPASVTGGIASDVAGTLRFSSSPDLGHLLGADPTGTLSDLTSTATGLLGDPGTVLGDATGTLGGVLGDPTGLVDGVLGGATGTLGGVLGDPTGTVDGVLGDATGTLGGVLGDPNGTLDSLLSDPTGAVNGLLGPHTSGLLGNATAPLNGLLGPDTSGLLNGTLSNATGALGGTLGGATGLLGHDATGLSLNGLPLDGLAGDPTGALTGLAGDPTGALTGLLGQGTDGLLGQGTDGLLGQGADGLLGSALSHPTGLLGGGPDSLLGGGTNGLLGGTLGDPTGALGHDPTGAVTGALGGVTGTVGGVTGTVGGVTQGLTGGVDQAGHVLGSTGLGDLTGHGLDVGGLTGGVLSGGVLSGGTAGVTADSTQASLHTTGSLQPGGVGDLVGQVTHVADPTDLNDGHLLGIPLL